MRIFRGRAFTSKEKIDGKDVLGNPASVVICENKLPTEEEMGKIAIEQAQPMTVFVKQNKGNDFNIEYFTPDGLRFNICGHATVVASYFLNNLYGYSNITFRLHGYCENLSIEFIQSEISTNGIVRLNMPAYIPTISSNKDCMDNYMKAFNFCKEDIRDFYYCKELRDFIIVLKSKNKIRNANPNLKLLSKISLRNNIRGVFLTSESECKDIDYEIRLFDARLMGGEDVACGSGNCSILPLWGNLLKTAIMKNFKILCPYKKTRFKLGGLEIGGYSPSTKRILIGGFVNKD